MRILHVTHNYPPESLAGVEVHVWRLARAQRARGHEVLVFSGSERGAGDEAADGASYEGIPLVQVHRTEDPGRAAWSRLTRLHDPAIVRRFDDVMRALRPEVVHVHHLLNLCWSLPWMARRMGARTVFSVHDFWALCPGILRQRPDGTECPGPGRGDGCAPCQGRGTGAAARARAMARVQAGRRLLGSVDRLVAPSQHVVTLLEREGVPPGRISHVPYGVPRGEPGRRDRSGRRPLVLGYIGSIKRHKGLDELCQAVHDLPARLRVRLEIHGDPERDAAYGHYLRHRTANEPRIRFMGPFEPRELPDVLRRLDLLLVPSTWPETGPQVALEALAGGVPVLASRIGGLEEVVRPGVHGFLVPPGDPDELGAELRRVAEEPGVLDRLRWRPDEIPDEAACAERMDEAYRRCVGR